MKVITDLNLVRESLPLGTGTSLTVGVFDGLHLGHQALIRRTVEEARRSGLASLIVTFAEHPLSVLAPPYTPRRLIYPDRKQRQIERLFVDLMLNITFTHEFAGQTPVQFVNALLAKCAMRVMVCGYDFTFGSGGTGSTADLARMAEQRGFRVLVFDPVAESGIAVKSTMVRDLLLSGHVQQTAHFLSRPYELRGQVMEGLGRGRTLGIPTANLQVSSRHIIPQVGVYLCFAQVRDTHILYPALVNIGTNPTFGARELTIEAHLLGATLELVGKELILFFARRLRDERKFANADALTEQIRRDREVALELLGSPELEQIRKKAQDLAS